MAMAVDNRQQLSGLPYHHPVRYTAPQFTNPWASAHSAPSGQMYATSMTHGVAPTDQARHSANMTASSGASQMSYPATAATTMPSLQMQSAYAPRPYVPDYSSAAASSAATYPAMTAAAAPQFNTPLYAPVDQSKLSAFGGYPDRRASHPLQTVSEAERNSFSDALDASRGMVAMSQDITPRNIYGNQGSARSSTDSYGFPSTHSAHSSISSASTYPSYYGSSVSEASYGDYSSASESVDGTSRTLPRPMGATLPPAPQSMMGQFSSKVASLSQKKHKCKICEKRFTRPSSLQTHMYSHTGEKPFACDVEGCGRHFSVVSNLRRHKKVHKGGSDHTASDDELD